MRVIFSFSERISTVEWGSSPYVRINWPRCH